MSRAPAASIKSRMLARLWLDRFIPAPFEGVHANDGAPHGIHGRREERNVVHALGADGEIDSFAAAVVRYAPEGQAEVLARLAIDYETVVQFVTPLGPVYATLYWRNGCIEAEISAPGRIVKRGKYLEWYEEVFDADDAQALLGLTPFDVLPLPFDAKCTIKQATPLHRGMKMQLNSSRLLVNCATGCIWER